LLATVEAKDGAAMRRGDVGTDLAASSRRLDSMSKVGIWAPSSFSRPISAATAFAEPRPDRLEPETLSMWIWTSAVTPRESRPA